MVQVKAQTNQSLNLRDYNKRVIVAGTRGYNDRVMFHNVISSFVNDEIEPILFISGAAATGADRLIIQWCNKFVYPCLEYPADWDLGRSAGYRRNEQMAEVATGLIAFYDGTSPGTGHMIDLANEYQLPIKVIKI